MNNILGEVNKQKRLKIIVKNTVPPYLPVCSAEVGFFVTGEPPNEWPSNHCFKMKTETNNEGLAIVNMSHEDDDIYPFYFLHLTVKKTGYLTTGIDYFDLLQASSQPITIYLTEENNMIPKRRKPILCEVCNQFVPDDLFAITYGLREEDYDKPVHPDTITVCQGHGGLTLHNYRRTTPEHKTETIKQVRKEKNITLTSR